MWSSDLSTFMMHLHLGCSPLNHDLEGGLEGVEAGHCREPRATRAVNVVETTKYQSRHKKDSSDMHVKLNNMCLKVAIVR